MSLLATYPGRRKVEGSSRRSLNAKGGREIRGVVGRALEEAYETGDVQFGIFAHVRNGSKRDAKVTRRTPKICIALANPLFLTFLPAVQDLIFWRSCRCPSTEQSGTLLTGRAEITEGRILAYPRIECFYCGRHCELNWAGGRVRASATVVDESLCCAKVFSGPMEPFLGKIQ